MTLIIMNYEAKTFSNKNKFPPNLSEERLNYSVINNYKKFIKQSVNKNIFFSKCTL